MEGGQVSEASIGVLNERMLRPNQKYDQTEILKVLENCVMPIKDYRINIF
jgi:hypothetical protein